MKRLFALALALCAGAAFAQDLTPTGDKSILSEDARLEVLFDGAFFTEGPAVAPDGSVYFSDITMSEPSGMQAGHIWRYDPETGATTVYRSPSGMSNGLKFDAQGRLIAAEGADFGGRRVTRTDLNTGKAEIIAGLYEGRPFNAPNDISIDEKGRIYFSDPRYIGHEPIYQPVQGVYRIDPDGSVHRIIADAGKPNGVCVSPDQQSIYVVSNGGRYIGFDSVVEAHIISKGAMALLAYDLQADGTATFREVLVDYAPQDGPDGLVADVDGNLYVAVRDMTRPGIAVYSPQGQEIAFIPTPVRPTNVAFGHGKNSRTLYVTYGGGAGDEAPGILAKIQVHKDGYHLPAQ